MSADAIAMMVLAMVVLWGGLIAAVLNLSRSEEPPTAEPVRDL